MKKPDHQNIGNAGEYFIASKLSASGYITTMTLGRAEKYDILAISPKGKTVKIQVKTAWHDNNSFRLSPKDEIDWNEKGYYAFVTLRENKKPWDYYIFPSKIVTRRVRESHEKWLKTPGKKGQKHNDSTVRIFGTKPGKYSSKWFTEKLVQKYKNNIYALEK